MRIERRLGCVEHAVGGAAPRPNTIEDEWRRMRIDV